jgi:hypothetical protein
MKTVNVTFLTEAFQNFQEINQASSNVFARKIFDMKSWGNFTRSIFHITKDFSGFDWKYS